MNIAEPPLITTSEEIPIAAVRSACALIPPLYNLENFLAVNPFLGWSVTPLPEASAKVSDGLNAEFLPSIQYYQEHWQNGRISSEDVARAAMRHGIPTDEVMSALSNPEASAESARSKILLESERVFQQQGIELPKVIRRFVSRSLADICSHLVSDLGDSITPAEIYKELIDRASRDRTFALVGVTGWRNWMASAPSDPLEAIRWVFEARPRAMREAEDYAYRLLGSQYGWASFLRGLGWNSGSGELGYLEALCAALQTFDLAIAELMPSDGRLESDLVVSRQRDDIRLCLQDAYEDRLVKSQLAEFLGKNQPPPSVRADFQMMFCIDVRSEVMRRNLEALSPHVETAGFAGFFGVGVDFVTEDHSSPRCPVLLQPQIELKSRQAGISEMIQAASRKAYSTPGSFNLIETIGIGYIVSLLGKATGRIRKVRPDESSVAASTYARTHFGLTLAERVALAESILTNSGIGNRLGRIVVLCGHGGRSSNNAHEASLDCGACGGHCGAVNAQMAVEILNDTSVREELVRRGYAGMADALFIAAQHDTSTDVVTLFQTRDIPQLQRQMVMELQELLAHAATKCRAERARMMGIEEQDDQKLLATLDHKANDWSEVRPEWGLARNASFIAAPRSRTRGANLDGRTFLHNYDSASDIDNSILKLIVSAPVVVASWINLQYFASTVNNERFGCGTKALLNRIGKIGVISGNEGDLRPGLPLESVHCPDGTWFHDPVRLQVIVEAPMQKIDAVLDQVPAVAELFKNGWARLLAIEKESDTVHLKRKDGDWEVLA